MLNCVTGVPGACKTAFVVTQLDNVERKNKIHLKKNIAIFEYNKQFFEKYAEDFTYVDIETGSGHTLKKSVEFLQSDYFDMLGQEFDHLRPDDYYFRSVRYNEIIERIRDRGEKEDFQFFQPVRTIYTNIKALKIDYVRSLEIDWRTCPDGSIMVIDEVQLVPPYNDNKNKNEEIVQELTIHRHRGFDFWFITQSPSYLHPTIKELISCHYHVTRPYWRTPKVYQFGSLRAYPNTLVNKLNCESKFSFKPKPAIFKLYKSTSIDTSKKRTPKGLIGFALFICFGLFVFSYGASGGLGFLGHFFGSDKKEEVKQQTSNQENTNFQAAQNSNFNADQECRKAVNVEKPECVQWFNDLSKNPPTANGSPVAQKVSYDSNKPYEFQPEQTVQIADYPRLSGCAKKPTGELVALDQQGNIMPNISKSDCQKWLDGVRPFNYAKAPVQVQNNQQKTETKTDTSKDVQFTLEQIAKIQQAKQEGLI